MKPIFYIVFSIILCVSSPAFALDTVREVLLHNGASGTATGSLIQVDYFTTASLEVIITGTATITWEETASGSRWNGGVCVKSNDPVTLVSTATTSGLYHCSLAAVSAFRARISSYSSGLVSVYARVTTTPFSEIKISTSSNGSDVITSITNPVAVTGTFWQSTQPVSIASMPSTPVTGTFFQATQPVSGTFWQATQPVSGTFFQATQPVSIASMPSTPVTGTFWQSTQPMSASTLPLPSNAASETGGNLAAIATNTPALVLGAQPVSVMRSIVPTPPLLPSGLNRLQFATMTRQYCQQTLCPTIPGGLK